MLKATLYVSLVINIINIILDLVFVFGLNMGVKGVALASVIAQYSGIIVALFFCSAMLKKYPDHWKIRRYI